MPEIGGLEVLEQVRKTDSDIPFIMLSSRGSVKEAVRSIRKGASDFILEPPHPDELEITIKNAYEISILQQKLQSSQTDYKRLVENVPDVIYSLDPKGRFLSISPACESILGYKPSELEGTLMFDLIHPEDREDVRHRFMESQRSGKAHLRTVELRMVTKSGEVRHIEVRGRTAIENGRIVRGDGIARDITERYQFEQELAQRQDELRAILDAYPNAIVMVDQDGRLRTANRGIDDFFGVSIQKLVDKPFQAFLDTIKDRFEDFDSFLKISKEMLFPKDLVRPDEQDAHWFMTHSVQQIKPKVRTIVPVGIPIQDQNGEKLGQIWIYNDITAIKRSFDNIQTIVNASPLPVLASRLSDGTVIFINQHMARLLGYDASEIKGQKTPDFYDNPKDRDKVVTALLKDGHVHNQLIQIKKADNSRVWVLFSTELVNLGEEQVALTGLYDISKRVEIEQALELERNFVNAVLDTAGALVVVIR